ncbi:MAG: hypothetical protein M5U26_18615 [Planctomycetota bacterium]|nr:hypothetical protein [Planctomycetota bacterium]
MPPRIAWALGLAVLLLLPGCEEPVGPDDAEMRRIFEEARELDRQGRYHEAMVRYETILARHPNWMSTRLNAAMAAYDSAQYQKAVEHFEILHKYGPKDWFVIRKLVQCYERLDNRMKINEYRQKLLDLRLHKDGSEVLKSFQGFTRDYIPVGTTHLIGYEFFDPQEHGKLWYFKLEDLHRKPLSGFLVEASPYFDAQGRRMFYITESCPGWMRVWFLGTIPTAEGGLRDYHWARTRVEEILQGKHRPLVVKPLPPGVAIFDVPDSGPAGAEGETKTGKPPAEGGKQP